MTDISFSPTFKHVAWVDNRDRVAAGGQNGFNVRFDAIQRDLEKLSGVVTAIDAGLKAVAQRPVVQRKLTLAPTFAPVQLRAEWVLDATGVATRASSTDITLSGLLTVTPPDGVQLLTLGATGRNAGDGTLKVTLFRNSLSVLGPPEQIAEVTCSGGAFGEAQPVTSGKGLVDMSHFSYFVNASLDGATAGGTVYITSVQLSYNAA
ncbi:hypothetical protein [Streptomyces sp. NPDC003943]